MSRSALLAAVAVAAATAAVTVAPPTAVAAPAQATAPAWRSDGLAVDRAAVLGRSDVVLRRAGTRPDQSLPLGNGRLGAAVWEADGLTVQLNRADQFPSPLSVGRLVLPGLARMTGARDFGARLQLSRGELRMQGGGMRATLFVDARRDRLVVDVSGAATGDPQTAELRLWEGRSPKTWASGGLAAMGETQLDAENGRRTGEAGVLSADGRDVRGQVVDGRTVRLTTRPRPDGGFRVVVATGDWDGADLPTAAARTAAGALEPSDADHLAWWSRLWSRATPLRIDTADGTGEYLEAMRAISLYTTAASTRGRLPVTHGGLASLFSFSQDASDWSPVGFWHYNQRQAAYAVLGAGVPELDDPYFRLYTDNLAGIEAWTRGHLPGYEGACFAEVMRYDGGGDGEPDGTDCDGQATQGFHTRLLSTGPEIAMNVLLRYRYTGDEAFLRDHWPVVRDAVAFLLSYGEAHRDATGTLHWDPSNALETYWDTRDPATDVAAATRLFGLVADTADHLGVDAPLAARLRDAARHLPALPAVPAPTGGSLLLPAARFDAPRNVEPVTPEPIWPWNLFGDRGEGHDSAVSTFRAEPLGDANSWSMKPLVAARLGLADEVASRLNKEIDDFQIFPSGFALFSAPADQLHQARYTGPYLELGGAITSTLQDALVQRYDGLLRIAPAWPQAWSGQGTVAVEGGHRVSAQVAGGEVRYVGIVAGSDDALRLRSPWPAQPLAVSEDGRRLLDLPAAGEVTLPLRAGHAYLVTRADRPLDASAVQELSGTPARDAKTHGSRTLGLTGDGSVPAPVLASGAPGSSGSPAGSGRAGAPCRARVGRVQLTLRRRGALVRGRVSTCRGARKVRRVRIAVAVVRHGRCRFVRARGGLRRSGACRPRRGVVVRARGRFALRVRGPLPRGRYRVFVRLVGGGREVRRSGRLR